MPGGQGWIAQGVPFRFIIGYMYWVPTSQVTGGPAWLDQFWDIVGKTDHPRQLEDLREMFRNLLTDEFKLKLRKEPKVGPIYALTVDKSGLKMKRDEDPWDYEESMKPGSGEAAIGKRVSIQRLCYQIQRILESNEKPVIDKTGLLGYYDYTLSTSPGCRPVLTKRICRRPCGIARRSSTP